MEQSYATLIAEQLKRQAHCQHHDMRFVGEAVSEAGEILVCVKCGWVRIRTIGRTIDAPGLIRR